MTFTLLALVLTASPATPDSSRTIDVETAVRLALDRSPGLNAVRFRAEAVEDQARSVRGRMLPSINLQDEDQRYSDKFAIKFDLGIPGAPVASLVARELNTNTFVAAATQPVLGLLHLYQDKVGLDDAAAAAHQGEAITRDAIIEGVQTGYLRYFEAKAAADVATSSISQLDEQHQVTEARVKAGAATTADLLRVEVAAANAKQQRIAAETQEQIAYSALLLAMGFDAEDGDVVLLEPVALEKAAASGLSEREAQAQAAVGRPEVERARLEQSAAEHQATAKLFALLPEANLQAAYLHVYGQGPFAPPDSLYVGFKASWPIWEWGASWYQRQAAARNADAAAQARAEQVRTVKAEASSRHAALRSSKAAVEVSRTAIASAEEAWRVTQALVKAGAATTTDLLDAQSALTQAKLNLVRATYQQAVAGVALTRALGPAK